MEFKQKIKKDCYAVKITAEEGGKERGRAYLYVIYNDLHNKPYGLLEDVFVEEKFRGRGLGAEIVSRIIEEAKERGCYKLLADSRMSRPEVHLWYEKFGFIKYGFEFRMDFKA